MPTMLSGVKLLLGGGETRSALEQIWPPQSSRAAPTVTGEGAVIPGLSNKLTERLNIESGEASTHTPTFSEFGFVVCHLGLKVYPQQVHVTQSLMSTNSGTNSSPGHTFQVSSDAITETGSRGHNNR